MEEDLYSDDDDTNTSTHPIPYHRHRHTNVFYEDIAPSHYTSTGYVTQRSGDSGIYTREPTLPCSAGVPAMGRQDSTEGEELTLEEIRGMMESEIRHDEESIWARKGYRLEQMEYSVTEREQKLKLHEEELGAHLAQLARRIYTVQLREFELMQQQQSLEAWAHQIEQDKATIEQRWYDLRQREAELEERNRVPHHQQQARFQHSTAVPDANVPSILISDVGFSLQGTNQRETVLPEFVPTPGWPRDQSISSCSSIDSFATDEVPGFARKASSIDVDAELAASMAATPQERASLDRAQISQSKKASTQQSTDSRGDPPTTMEDLEGCLRPLSLSCLRGVDKIIDEIEFVLTDEARSYEWKDGGLKLHTPHGALPTRAVPCRVSVKASLSGQFEFPENSELVSPVYWISTPKNLRFSRPLTVDFQHCCTMEERDDSDLSFVVAKCTQPDLPYKFKFLDGGCFIRNSSYGSISVTHFSGLGIVSKQRKGRSYCARTYVSSRGKNCWSVHFVIIRDLDIVLKAVDAHYSFARRDVALRIVFEHSEISLDIPNEGQLINEGWKILPRSYPSISMRDADKFRVGQWIPACELIVEWEKRDKRPDRLRHHVPLIGAKAPRNFFNIAIDPEWEEKEVQPPQQTNQEYAKQDLCDRYPAGLEDKPELCDLMNEVAAKIPGKWRQIGIELRLTPDELDGFPSGDALRCFSSVFILWQKRMSREPYSWLTVVESLKALAVGEHKLALELSDKLTRTC